MIPLRYVQLLTLIHPIFCLGVPVTIPISAPSAAPSISPSLVSLSIEQDRWTDWVGAGSRNQFFFNVLDNLRALTGRPPHIRIGADSEDHTNFDGNVKTTRLVFPAHTPIVPYPEARNITVGNAFYEAAQFLPPHTHVTWGVNFGQYNLTAAFLEAKAIVKAFSSSAIRSALITLEAIEIGNEADLYNHNGMRASTYNITKYVREWTHFATNVSAAAGISSKSPTKFWGCAFAESSRSSRPGFSPKFALSQGLLSSPPGQAISTISQHHYSGSFCSGNGDLLQNLMTKVTIRKDLSYFTPDIKNAHSMGLDYVLGETNSYSCHGAPGVSNTAGAALWALDYVLFATQIGISRVFFHGGVGYKYNLIQPITLTRSILDGSPLSSPLSPHVQPQYYAAVVAGEAIGSSGTTHAVELAINNPRIAGYAFYEGSKLVRAVFINSNAYLKTTTTNRTRVKLDLSFTGICGFLEPSLMTVKRLAIGHADDTSGVTWGGRTYETSNSRVSGQLNVTTAKVSDGVDIAATEVVMVSFQW